MSRRLTFVTLTLTAVVAFLVGAIFAGGVTRTAIVSSAPRSTAPKPASHPAAAVSPLVSFADVVERINAAVVNIDATSRGRTRGGAAAGRSHRILRICSTIRSISAAAIAIRRAAAPAAASSSTPTAAF